MDSLEKRTEEFKRNPHLENLLKEINSDLSLSEKKLLKQGIQEIPVIFIMGASRTGSTLLVQWLASLGVFCYPTNLISRFYGAPIIGSKIQLLLTDRKYNFRNEIMDFSSEITFNSDNGKTRGALETNEFWHFWRRFIPDDLRKYTSEELFANVDIETFRQELWGMAQVFGKPIALKGMICNYHIPFLDKVFEKAIFISLHRNLERQTKSLLEARKRQFGTYEEWYAFLIPEYEDLIRIPDPKVQVREQIKCINNAVEKGLKNVSNSKKIQVEYEEFCKNPRKIYYKLLDKLEEQGYKIDQEYNGKKSFIAR